LADGVWDRVAELRDMLEDRLSAEAPDAILVGKGAKRLPNTTAVTVPGWKGETQVMQMDLAGYAISAGSACSSGKVRASKVLTAMGFDEMTAASAIRVSLGPKTSEQDVMGFADKWLAQMNKHRASAR
jgi:cysteine desulfurase